MNHIRSVLSFIIVMFFLTTSFAFAQVTVMQTSGTLDDGDTTSDCVTFQSAALRFGSRDSSTGGDVTVLQDFLITKGLLYGQTTGYYGKVTVASVKKYQKSVGVSQTGNVGPLTKSLIVKETCTGNNDQTPTPIVSTPTVPVATVSTPSLSFTQTSGWTGSNVSSNKANVKIGSFTVQNTSSEGVTISNILLGITGSMINSSSLSNVLIKDGLTTVGVPVGNPTASNNFSVSLVVPSSAVKTFDVYADIGSVANTVTVVPAMTITYRGNVSNITTTSGAVTGATVTAGIPTIISSGVTFLPYASAQSQSVVGGQTSFAIGTFNIKANNGIGGATIKDVTVTVPANTISSVTINGITAQVVGTTATLYDMGIMVPSDTSGINVAMTVSLNCVIAVMGCSGTPDSYFNAAITKVTYNDGSAIQTIYPTAVTATHKLVSSASATTSIPTIISTTTAPVTELGAYRMYLNGNISIATESISKVEALSNCKSNATNNLTKTTRCTWNGVDIYLYTPVTTTITPVAGPKSNAMSCSKPSKTGLGLGSVACYGIWDYGDEFGNDPDMCPQYGYSDSRTGCVVKTQACASGQAIASKLVSPLSMDVNGSEVATYANNLNSSKEAVKTQIIKLWEYTCSSDGSTIPQSSSPVSPVSVSASDSELHVLGVYEASSNHSFCYSTQGSVSVKVKKTTKPVTLALSSYEPVKWNIALDPGAEVKQVIVGGYDEQTVTGLPTSVPVNTYAYYTRDDSMKGKDVGNGFFYDSSDPNGKYYDWATMPNICPESAAIPTDRRVPLKVNSEFYFSYKVGDEGYSQWIAKLKSLTGLTPTSFQGDYTKTSFTVPNSAIVLGQNPSIDGGGNSYFIPQGSQVLGASIVCTTISRNIHRGDESTATSKLQSFLHDAGFLSDNPTGFYGDKTVEAVKAYQKSKGIKETGMVYDITRAGIRVDTCGE